MSQRISSTKASTRIGLFALLLGVIVLSLFGGLVAADRALAAADRESVQHDARATALLVERELRLRASAIGASMALASDVSRPRGLGALPTGVSAAWLLDSSGRVLATSAADPTLELASTTTVSALARHSTSTSSGPSIGVARRPGGRGGVLLVAAPTRTPGGGTVTVGALPATELTSALGTEADRWARLRDSVGDLVAAGARQMDLPYVIAVAPVALGGDRLHVQVGHAGSGRVARTGFWLVGSLGLIALLVGLARERRQAIQLGARTAELERLYQEVARSNRMKSEFLANVSHELRTPLNAIVGFVEMLRENVYGELTPRQALPVDRIAASATHLRHLVDRLLDIAKIAAGRLEIHPEPLVLRPFVLNVASEMESLVSERGLALSIAVGPTLPRIRTDHTHLRQILINLIGNAVKYTPSGAIQVRAEIVGNGARKTTSSAQTLAAPPAADRTWIALQVSDTGVGIASSDLERIFDEFEQVNAGARTDSARRGTGLGLAISRRLARLLGGDLTVVSEVGRGSTFTVWLPMSEEPAPGSG